MAKGLAGAGAVLAIPPPFLGRLFRLLLLMSARSVSREARCGVRRCGILELLLVAPKPQAEKGDHRRCFEGMPLRLPPGRVPSLTGPLRWPRGRISYAGEGSSSRDHAHSARRFSAGRAYSVQSNAVVAQNATENKDAAAVVRPVGR